MLQIVQIVGALAILGAFLLAQLRVLDGRSSAYLVPNLLGGATLAVVAYLGRDWGFLVLEASWALVSAWGLATRPDGGVEAVEEQA